MDARRGLEPRFTVSETGVLPLDDPAKWIGDVESNHD